MTKTNLVLAAMTVAAFGSGCNKLKDHAPGGVPTSAPSMPGGSSGEVDPDTCGNYAAVDAGMKLKAFLRATKDLQTTTIEVAKVVKQSCIMMGNELAMPAGDLEGDDTDAICHKVIEFYKNNLKISLKTGASLKVVAVPAKCTVDANASASAGGGCSGGAAAGNGGGGAGGQCAAAAQAEASVHAECTPPQFSIDVSAGMIIDKSRFEMTVKALKDGIPQLLSVQGRIAPIKDALVVWSQAAKDLAEMGPKFAQSFADQALCISGQIAAVAKASTQIHANVDVSVSVSASASGSVGSH